MQHRLSSVQAGHSWFLQAYRFPFRKAGFRLDVFQFCLTSKLGRTWRFALDRLGPDRREGIP